MIRKLLTLTLLFFAAFIVKAQQHFEKSFLVVFPNGVANQVAYIQFPTDVPIYGSMVVEVSGGYNSQLNMGYLAKRIMMVKNPGGYFNQVTEVLDANGPLANQWNIGDFDQETYQIPIYHLVSTGNTISIKVSGQLSHQASAQQIASSASISAPIQLAHGKKRQYKSVLQDRIGVGTESPDYTMDVVGKIRAHEILVNTNKTADYVFAEDYQLPDLNHVKAYIEKNKHLPDIPSAKEMKRNGINVGDLQIDLLKKIEELTLHIIQQQEELNKLKNELTALKNASNP